MLSLLSVFTTKGILGGIITKMWPPVDLWTGSWQSEVPHPLPCPWNVASAFFPCSPRLPQGHSLEILMWCWDRLDGICEPIQLRVLYKLLSFGRQVQRSTVFVPLKTSLVYKFPCLLNLPPTNLEWTASFLSLSLPSLYGGQFQMTPRILPQSLWTNKEVLDQLSSSLKPYWTSIMSQDLCLALRIY